jgi:hypothetical protein
MAPPLPRTPAWAPWHGLAHPSAVLVACALALAAASPAFAQIAFGGTASLPKDSPARDTAYVDAVIQLDIENGPSDVVPALANGATLLLPLRQFFDMVEIRIAAFALHDSAVAVLEPGHVALRFNPAAGVLTKGASRVPYDSMDVVWWDGDLFVATGLLDELLGVRTSVEWANLSAMVGHAAALPVNQRIRRERRHQLLYRPRPALGTLDIPLRQRAVDGAVLSWSLTAATSGPTNQLSLDLGLGAGVLGGSAELRPQLWSDHGASGSQLLASWTRAWSGSYLVRQVRLGDVQSNGLRSRLLEGGVITNAPFIRSSEFDVEPYVGNVPAGWEVELYDGGRLMGYADANAMGSFRVPLQLRYGQNPFNLVLYGPSGEIVQQKHTIRVPASRLPGGRLEYALALGGCRYDPCNGLLSADVRYGLSDHVTLQGGSDAFFQGPQGTLWQPYAVLSAAPLPSVAITGEGVVNGHVRAEAAYEPTDDLRADASYTRYAPAGALYSGAATERAQSDASLFWRPGWMHGALFFEGNGLVSSGPGMRQSVERLSATTLVNRIRYSLGVLHSALDYGTAGDTSQFAFDASADAMLLGPWPWLRTSTVQGQIAIEPTHGLTAIRAAVGRRLSQLLRLDAAIGWFRAGGITLELGLTTAMPGPRVGSRSRVTSGTGSSELTFAYGAVAFDPRSRLLKLGDGADLGRGGISGVLFRDDNGNGVRDPGEPGLEGVPVSVGGWPAKTDADGRFAAWGLSPSEPIQIDVDTLSFADPHYLLPAPVIRVTPTPNAFGDIQVPVQVGGEVSGFVVLGDQALPGVPVVLRELDTGAEVTMTTFEDGGFYKASVPPGWYQVTLPDAVLDRLKAVPPLLSIQIPPGPGDGGKEKRFDDLELRLVPRP